jgi:cytochrome P450
MFVTVPLALLAVSLSALLWTSWTYLQGRLRRGLVPASCKPFRSRYPHLDPVFGLDLSLRTWREFHSGALCEGLQRRFEKLGDTFLAKDLGADIVYTIDPDNIRWVTTHQFEDFGKSAWAEEAKKHVGHGVLMNDGEAWKRSRSLLRPIFARTALDEPALLEPHVQDMLRVIRAEGTNRRSFDFQAICRRFTLDVVTDFLFGRSTLSLSDDPAIAGAGKDFLAFVDTFDPRAGSFMAVGLLAWIELIPAYRLTIAAAEGMKAFFRKHLHDIVSGHGADSTTAGTSCFRRMKTAGMPLEAIRGELSNVFFASFDTTTALLSNLVGILAQNQDVLAQLRREIAFLHGKPPDRTDLSNIPYVQWVVLEGEFRHAVLPTQAVCAPLALLGFGDFR